MLATVTVQPGQSSESSPYALQLTHRRDHSVWLDCTVALDTRREPHTHGSLGNHNDVTDVVTCSTDDLLRIEDLPVAPAAVGGAVLVRILGVEKYMGLYCGKIRVRETYIDIYGVILYDSYDSYSAEGIRQQIEDPTSRAKHRLSLSALQG